MDTKKTSNLNIKTKDNSRNIPHPMTFNLILNHQATFVVVLVFNLAMIGAAGLFVYESWREQESRAIKIGLLGIAAHNFFVFLLFYSHVFQLFLIFYMLVCVLFVAILVIPGRKNSAVLKGTAGYVVGEVLRFDERDIVFARNENLVSGSEQYSQYYEKYPERKERDDKRRAKGGHAGKVGSIDKCPPMLVNMVAGNASAAHTLVANSLPQIPERQEPIEMEPLQATEAIKRWAIHLGADLVGVARIDERWIYSRKGHIHASHSMDNWGQEIKRNFTHAVVIATEMDHDVMYAAPHTPVLTESMRNYSKGAFISSVIANWFTQSGYEAVANSFKYYESLMVPLAIDAGIGQFSRMGYLVTEKFGARVRLAAVLTNMPLVADKPVDLGVDEFCQACKKCAESCPSRSIPMGDKTVKNGLLRWMLDDQSCYDYWGRVGSDCGVCMIICPYSRPNRSLHRLVKWLLKRSPLARKLLPHLDNLVYGKTWKTRRPPAWVNYKPQ